MQHCGYNQRVTEKTLDLSQAAAPTTYDAATAAGDVLITGVTVYCSVAGGGDLTSVSIQTDATTSLVLMTAGEGIAANLLAQSHPTCASQAWISPWTLRSGQKIQYTITAAGAAHTGTIKLVLLYKPITNGATL